jgi:hypothetical protein
MKSLLALAASTLVLAACTAGAEPTERARLDCPQKEGELSRTGMAADGKSCTYRTAAGDEINLQLIATGGQPERVLDQIEAEITPKAQAAAAVAQADATLAQARAEDARRAAEQAERDAADARRKVEHDLPGARVTVEVDENESSAEPGRETTSIRLPGIRINAEDDKADVRIGGMQINAEGDKAVMSMRRSVRLKGQAFAREKRGLRAMYIYTGGALPEGVGAVGYEAGGPKAGPLTVAVVKAKDAERRDSELYDDVQRLVRRNGGV